MRPTLIPIGLILLGVSTPSLAQIPKRQAVPRPATPTAVRQQAAPPAARPVAPATPRVAAPASAPAPATTASQQDADRQAIAALLDTFTRAFNAGDAKAAAETYVEDALVIDEDGNRIEGRGAIAEQLAQNFSEFPGDTIAITTNELRFLGPDTALEQGQTAITQPEGAAPETSRFTVIYVRQEGKWLQSVVRDERLGEPSAHDRLQELAWMVGQWVNESADSVVNTTCEWSDDGSFLTREFTVKARGEALLSGTQRIGWDPTRKQFRTWIFDSQGGFGEGYWTRRDDQWVIKTEGVRQDGLHASATSIVTYLGPDRASWQTVDRTLGGEALPETDAIILVRKPPEPGK